MSLYALPVTIADLEQLQNGIQFFTGAAEATAEAALINAGTQTVFGYAQQLINNNVSLSQVAVAVDALMFGAVDSVSEMTKLATQFLPAQMSNAQANGFNPTVYDAEALGLALAGGNGTSAAFATTFGSLSATQFAQAVSTTVFGNVSLADAILGYVNNWIVFYTANPSATQGLSITLASYGAAFGDAVGLALANQAAGQIGAGLGDLVSNVLIDLSENAIRAGLALGNQPQHIILEDQAGKTFTLTANTDTFTTGTGNDIYNAPFSNSNQTLTDGDRLIDSGFNNVLNAFLLGTPTTIQIAGIQTWNITNLGGAIGTEASVTGIIPASFGAPGPSGVAFSPGVQVITYQNSVGSLVIGGPSTGIQSLLTNLNVTDDTLSFDSFGVGPGGAIPFVNVFIAASMFTGADSLNVGINSLNESNTIIEAGHPIPFGPYGIIAGPNAGSVGYQTWTLNVQDSVGDTVLLGADGANNAKTINIADVNGATGSLELDASLGDKVDWANVSTINGTGMVGKLVISGAEGSQYGEGFLAANQVITTITAGSGGLFDLSSLSAAGLHSLITVNGGAGLGEVVFSNAAMIAATGPVALTDIDTLDDASATQGGIINMVNFPSVGELQFVNATPFDTLTGDILGSTLVISNGPTDFYVEFNGMNMNGQNVTISADAAGASSANGVLIAGLSPNGSVPTFTINNYTKVDLPVSGTDTIGSADFIDNVPVGAPYGPTIDITGTGNLALGHTVGSSLGPVSAVGIPTIQITGDHPGINTIGGLSGWLDIGATNASMVDATHATNLVMEEPATNTATGIVALGGTDANGHTNQLQGTMGVQTLDAFGNGYIGAVAEELNVLVGSVGADQIFGDGGPHNNINMNSAGNSAAADSEAYIGVFQSGFAGSVGTPIAPSTLYTQDITDVIAGSEVYVNGYGGNGTGTAETTISGFVVGSVGDILNLNAGSWIGTTNHQAVTGPTLVNTDIGLVQDDGATNVSIMAHNATLQLDTQPGLVIPGSKADIVLDAIATYANAAALATALKTAGLGDLILQGTGVAANTEEHVLIAYSTGTSINIADVLLRNTTEIKVADTAKLTTVSAFDLVQLTGQNGTTPTAILGTLNPHDLHFL